MDKSEIIKKVASVVEIDFNKIGFHFKKPNLFEKKEGNLVYQYQIDVKKSKRGGFSLHLFLMLINKEITDSVNKIWKKVLTDDRITFPSHWDQKIINDSIKTRTNSKYVTMLTDWRELKETEQSLQSFNNEFSVWLYSFMEIEEKENWKKQLQFSVQLAKKWFDLVSDEAYLIDRPNFLALYLLSKSDKEKAKEKFESILSRMQKQKQSTTELELFYEFLCQDSESIK